MYQKYLHAWYSKQHMQSNGKVLSAYNSQGELVEYTFINSEFEADYPYEDKVYLGLIMELNPSSSSSSLNKVVTDIFLKYPAPYKSKPAEAALATPPVDPEPPSSLKSKPATKSPSSLKSKPASIEVSELLYKFKIDYS